MAMLYAHSTVLLAWKNIIIIIRLKTPTVYFVYSMSQWQSFFTGYKLPFRSGSHTNKIIIIFPVLVCIFFENYVLYLWEARN